MITQVKINTSLFYVLLLVHVVLPISSSVFGISFFESIKSAVAMIYYFMFMLTFLSLKESSKDDYLDGFVDASVLTSIFGVIQYILISKQIVVSEKLVYPYGNHSALGKGMLVLLNAGSNWRSNSIFSEPSIFGFFLLLALLININNKNRSFVFNIILLMGIAVTKSVSVYTSLIVLLIAKFHRKKKFLLASVLTSFIGLTMVLMNTTVSGKVFSVFTRLGEVIVPGTSGYYRITAPMALTKHSLFNKPLGVGIGVTDLFLETAPENIKKYFIMFNGAQGYAVDNNFFLIVMWYGLGSAIFIPVVIYLWKICKKNKRIEFLLLLLLFLFSTGSFTMLVTWMFILPIIIMMFKPNEKNKLVNQNILSVKIL